MSCWALIIVAVIAQVNPPVQFCDSVPGEPVVLQNSHQCSQAIHFASRCKGGGSHVDFFFLLGSCVNVFIIAGISKNFGCSPLYSLRVNTSDVGTALCWQYLFSCESCAWSPIFSDDLLSVCHSIDCHPQDCLPLFSGLHV